GGGLMCLIRGNPRVTDCRFTRNHAHAGGGLGCSDSSAPILSRAIFEANEASGASGGVVYCAHLSAPQLDHCVMKDNHAVEGGVIGSWFDAEPLFTNCTFVGNSADGGAFLRMYSATSTFESCIIAFHRGIPFIDCAAAGWSGSPSLSCCDV